MMTDYILELEAPSKSEAEKEALEILQLMEDDVEFESSSGNVLKKLFKSSPNYLRVKANPNKQIPQESIARGIIYTILQKMNLPASVEKIEAQGDSIYISLTSEDSSFLIGKHGRSLDALQFIVNMLVNKRRSSSKRLVLDISNYRKRRNQIIEELCLKVAEKVVKTGKAQTLNTMSPYERRIVHVILENDERVFTESLGDGVYKRVRVFPKRNNKSKTENQKENELDYNKINIDDDMDVDGNYNSIDKNTKISSSSNVEFDENNHENDENFNR